ncbi:G-protein coupled receptor 84-like [Heptranchias perlo]|uniref:G-protein coupled receptor 84-like n=1 Tax=Heptranchias perlo TaxID=212740 RepID=UPI003559FD9A
MDANLTASNLTCDPSMTHYRYFGALLGTAVSAVGTVGNVMTVLAFIVDRKLRTKFNLLILNLTLADLLYCAFLQPITIDTYVHLGWRQGDTMCRVFGLLLFVANSVSIFNLATIALSRYVLVSDPRRFDRVYSRYTMPFFLAGPWLVALALFIPLWGVFEFLPTVCTCSFHRTRGRPYTTVLMVLLFGLGLGAIGVFYFLIDRKVKAAHRALEEHRLETTGGPPRPATPQVFTVAGEVSSSSAASSSGQTGEGARREERRRRRGTGRAGPSEFTRVTSMCLAMFGVFVACYLPFCLLNVADGNARAPPLAQAIVANFTWLNGCINPVLYAVMNRQFAQAYGGVLRKLARPFRLLGKR